MILRSLFFLCQKTNHEVQFNPIEWPRRWHDLDKEFWMVLERKYHILNMERQVHILDQWETTHIKFMRYKINLNISFYLEPWGECFWYESASVCTSVWSVDQTATVLMKSCLKYIQFLPLNAEFFNETTDIRIEKFG